MQEWKDDDGDDDDGDHVEVGCSMQHHLGYIFDEEICDCLTGWLVAGTHRFLMFQSHRKEFYICRCTTTTILDLCSFFFALLFRPKNTRKQSIKLSANFLVSSMPTICTHSQG